MTEQQIKDHELITNIWHMFRDYGDIQNNDPDAEARWIELNKFVDDTVCGIDDNNTTRFCMSRMLQALEDRTLGRKAGEGAKQMREEIAEEMCSHYCKYPETWNTERDGDLYESEICKNCPLGRLCA